MGPTGRKVHPGFLRGVKHRFAFWEQERKGLLGAEHTPREVHVVSHQHGLQNIHYQAEASSLSCQYWGACGASKALVSGAEMGCVVLPVPGEKPW